MKRVLNILIAISLIFSLSGCKKGTQKEQEYQSFDPELNRGGIVEAYILRPDTYNPLTTQISANRRMLSLCYDPLFYIDSQFNTVPRLAKNHTVSDNGKKITVTLRDDVVWHDGSKLTASDVVYTINKIVSSENSYYGMVIDGLINKVRTADTHTVDIYLNYSNSGAPALLTFPIIKQGTGFSSDYIPMGTGPFMAEGAPGESAMTLVRNPKWKCGHVYIDGVKLNILPDEDSVYSAFSTGVIDFVQITKENAGKFSTGENIGYLTSLTEKYTYIGLNTNNHLLASDQVRNAIYDSVDRAALTKAVLSDYGVPANMPIHPKAYYYSSEKEAISTDDIVKEEGVMYYRNPEDGSKEPLEFTLLVNEENVTRCAAADYFATALSENGIKTDIIKTDFETYTNMVYQGDFDMYIGTTRLSSDANLHPLTGEGGSLNHGGFYSNDLEDLLNNLLRSKTTSERTEVLSSIQKELYKKNPHIPLYYENEMIVYNSGKISNTHTVLADNLSGFVSMCCIAE